MSHLLNVKREYVTLKNWIHTFFMDIYISAISVTCSSDARKTSIMDIQPLSRVDFPIFFSSQTFYNVQLLRPFSILLSPQRENFLTERLPQNIIFHCLFQLMSSEAKTFKDKEYSYSKWWFAFHTLCFRHSFNVLLLKACLSYTTSSGGSLTVFQCVDFLITSPSRSERKRVFRQMFSGAQSQLYVIIIEKAFVFS